MTAASTHRARRNRLEADGHVAGRDDLDDDRRWFRQLVGEIADAAGLRPGDGNRHRSVGQQEPAGNRIRRHGGTAAAPTLAVNDADDDGRINASGTAEPGSKLTVTWPDGSTSTTTADGSGNWSVESPTPQGSGPVTATATDPSGNKSRRQPTSADMEAPAGADARRQ